MQHHHILFAQLILITLVSSLIPPAQGGNTPTPLSPRDNNLTRMKSIDSNHQRTYGGHPNFLIRPGLIADQTSRTVRVSAESIALEAGHPAEFPLITLGSGKDYEALAVSFASAADIHQALEFIGLRPGQVVAPERLRFWPKGDRVRVTFRYTASPLKETKNRPPQLNEIPAERLIFDTRTQKTLPETGFVFTGSGLTPAIPPATGTVYAADAFSPGGIISIYNEPSTVLDVPRRAAQQDVYSYQVPNPDIPLPSGALIEVLLEPFFRDNQPHRQDYSLNVKPGDNSDIAFALFDATGKAVNTNHSVNGFLASLGRITGPERDAFVELHPADTLTLKDMPTIAQFLSTLDSDRGIRMEPPPDGHPYYKAFMPNKAHRRREDRPVATAELHLATTGSTTTGELVFVTTDWEGNDNAPTFHETRRPIASPEQVAGEFNARKDAPSVILIFAPDSLTYGALRPYTVPLLKRNMILYVFSNQP
jgi:hypothetical protein